MRRGLGLLAALGVGALLAMQSRVNGTLGARLQDGIAAAVISFGGGLIVLLACTAAVPTARRGFRRIAETLRSGIGLRPWQCLGGVCGAFLVLSQGVTASALGIALFTVAVVAGQVVSGMVVDRFGLGPGGRQQVTTTRLIGAVLTLVAVVIAVSARLGETRASWLVVLPGLAGIGVAWQQAVNGRVKQTADSTVSASTLNFATGTAALVLAGIVEITVRGLPDSYPDDPRLYLGGLIGIFVIGGATVLVRYTGVLLLSMGMIAGQLAGALALDLIVPTPGTRIETSTLVGVGLTLVAAVVAALPAGPRTESARDLPR
ncbi:transporter family-2 protein [Halopolyspora algeriensis]|uniref:Transporter family-2 protein n=2 Tax=Halopolyspora algeriensis TaxID=1500506 RepID=A0A368VC05_9ACTN|nr:transporter family-2 protein [Halopolyspora algeriensis]TQM46681.1 transporter family-2 protein [Halopolyspora algeriensis]